jgi:dipeptidyl aminopeptidase/acylaminoacyl peptidase
MFYGRFAAMKRVALFFVSFVVACGGKQTLSPTPPAPAPDPVAEPVKPAEPVEPPAPQGHPSDKLIPRAVLFGNPERSNVHVSPDGKHLSWLAAKDGVMNVFVAPIDHLDQAKPVTNDTVRPIRVYFWSFDNKHVLYEQDKGGDENFHLFRADLVGGAPVDLTPVPEGARSQVMGISEKKPNIVVVGLNDRDAKYYDVYDVDIATGKRTLRYKNEDAIADFTLDPEMKIVFGTKTMPDGSRQISRFDGKAWKLWDTIPFEDSDTTGIGNVLPGGKRAYMFDSRGRDTAALFEVDISTKKPTVIAEDPGADVSNTIDHPTKHTIRAVSFERARQTWRALDKSIQPDLDGLAKLAEGGDFSMLSTTLDDKTWIVATSSPQHPGRIYMWNRAKHAGTFLFTTRPALDGQPLVDMSAVEIKSRDGLALVSYLTLPRGKTFADGRASAPAPMILFVHGGPWARDSYGYNTIHQLLANRGYAVLSVNYRGSTGFGKNFLNAANLQWSKKMHDDLLDAVAWAVAQGVTTKDQIAILGGSYGGYATLVGLAMTPDVFRCGVDIVGPSNLLTLVATIPPYWAPFIETFRKRMGDWETSEGKAALTAASPLTHAAKIARPLLIGQGANDPRVKQAESEQIVAAMKSHHLPVAYIVFPDEGHGFARPENNIAFFGATEAFLSANMGGEYAPLTAEELKASSMQVKDGKRGVPGL